MSIVYLNGKYLPIDQANISVLDRGFLFADSVYEVVAIYNQKPFHLEEHIRRLQSSLDSINLSLAMNVDDWRTIIDSLCTKNPGKDLSLYLQVTRGVQDKRTFRTPEACTPTVLAFVTPITFASKENYSSGFTAITTEDIRWAKSHIKTTALMANILLYQEAHRHKVDDAILIRDGYALEGPASNLFMTRGGVIVTPQTQDLILHGITRRVQIELMSENHIPLEQRNITESELLAADEIWLSSSTMEIRPIVELNGIRIGNGKPGPLWGKVFDLFEQTKRRH